MSAVTRVFIRNYDNELLGSIASHEGKLVSSMPGLQSMADAVLSRAGSPEQAIQELDGWQNGYLFASSDPDAAAS